MLPDIQIIETSWQLANERANGKLALKFYGLLFFWYPETRTMFPPGMEHQRDKLVHALGRVISRVDRLDEVKPELEALGRDHRRFGATSEHYGAVGSVLLRTLEIYLGKDWEPEVANAWMVAYGEVAQIMQGAAAAQEAAGIPPWWDVSTFGAQWGPRQIFIDVDSTATPPKGYTLNHGDRIDVRPYGRPGLWTTARVIQNDHRVLFGVTIRTRGGMDYAAMALSRTPDGGLVRVGPPSTPPDEEGDLS